MSFGGGFGTSTPGAANFSFGANTSTAATPAKRELSGFGSTSFAFGASTPATSNSALGGSVFGTPATQTAGFGATPGFGASAATGFGTPAASSTSTFTTTTPGFGFGATTGFGATPISSTGFGGSLGAQTSTTGSTGGFGGFGSFGSTAAPTTTTTPSLFGGFGSTNTTSTPFGGFGGFGAKPATSTGTGFGGFGTSAFSGFGSTLGQQQQQQQQQQNLQFQQNPGALSEALYNAIFNCRVFNDERDTTIARFNLIQALWGTGKAYYSGNSPALELNEENPLCRFKAIGYSRMPETDNSEGLVVLCFAKKEQEIKDGKPQLINSLNSILGNKPNLLVTVDQIKATKDSKRSQVTIFVTEKSDTGTTRKIPANELVAYLSQTMQKTQLTQMGVENIFPQVKLDPSQLKEYLENPPCSIDARLWKQAQLDNPNPDQYIPVPMIGFQQLNHRLKCQEEETSRYRAFLDMAADKIQDLQRQHTATQARLKEHRRTLLELQHKVLQILVRQEITRKVGLSLQPEEEVLTNRFEVMHSQISAPTQFKGRISEMLSQLRMRRHIDAQNQERYTMDPIAQDDIKTYLTMEQQGVAQLIDTINSDLECLKIIKDGMSKLVNDPNSLAAK